MWSLKLELIASFITVAVAVIYNNTNNLFRQEQIIFSSDLNISKILVPADVSKYVQAESSEMPTVFFTGVDPKSSESCIYVLEGLAAYEVLEGGRDSTSDYSSDETVYFGGNDGLYKYEFASFSAKKFGAFSDDIIQLQKVNGRDAFYILTKDNEMYLIENNGTVKSRVHGVACVSEFVLDTSSNIYVVICNEQVIQVIKPSEGTSVSVMEEFNEIKLIRPPFIMEKCIPMLLDGTLHLLYVNGTVEKKDFHMNERPTALSIEAALYLVVALNGKIYEFNVMDVLVRSMFGLAALWPRDMSKIVISIIDAHEESLFAYNKLIKN